MKVILVILIIALYIRGTVYKAAFLIMGEFITEKKHILPTTEEMEECANCLKKHWVKLVF